MSYERPEQPYGHAAHRETRADDPRGFTITLPPGLRNRALEELEDPMTSLRVFKAELRALRGLEMRDLVEAGIIEKNDVTEFSRFARDAVHWLLNARDDRAELLWTLVQKRVK